MSQESHKRRVDAYNLMARMEMMLPVDYLVLKPPGGLGSISIPKEDQGQHG